MSKPLQISPETAIKLSEQLKVPIEHLMHMPRHILLQKLAELAAADASGEQAAAHPESAGATNKKEDPTA